MFSTAEVTDWLLDSDPAIRWQVMRDLLDRPNSEWRAERARVETEGWGAQLLAAADDDGQWAGGAHFPADFEWGSGEPQPWTSTTHSLSLLREFGFDASGERGHRIVRLIGENCRWEHAGQPYWEGEVEPCINGITVANGTHFGVDMTLIVERLLGERLSDGAWKCEVENGAVVSSFETTINVLEGLLEHQRAGRGTPETAAAQRSAEEYLLERHLFRRLSTGEPAESYFLDLAFPHRWRFDILRGLDYFRSALALSGTAPDPRLADAIRLLEAKRRDDGSWNLERHWPGRSWFRLEGEVGTPSRWITLKALRVLRWWSEGVEPQ